MGLSQENFRRRHGKWLVVALLWFAGCFNYIARIMPTTMHRSLVTAIPMNEAQFGLVTTAFLWTYGLLNPIAGFMADRFNRSRVIMVSMLVWGVASILTGFSRTYPELVASRILMGISEASFFPAALALVADYHDNRTRSVATGLLMTGANIGAALGGMGGWIAERTSWNYAFFVVGALNVAHGCLLILLLRDPPQGPRFSAAGIPTKAVSFGSALRSLFSHGPFRCAFLGWGFTASVSWTVAGWMPTFLSEHFSLRQGEAGLSATGYTNLAGLTGMIVGGVWADRWSRRNERARIYVPVIGLCLAIAGLLTTSFTHVLALAFAGLAAFGISGGFSDSNTMPVLCMVADPRYRATSYGIMNLTGTLMGGLAILVAGALRDHHVSLSQIFGLDVTVLVFCQFLLLSIKLRPAQPQPA